MMKEKPPSWSTFGCRSDLQTEFDTEKVQCRVTAGTILLLPLSTLITAHIYYLIPTIQLFYSSYLFSYPILYYEV